MSAFDSAWRVLKEQLPHVTWGSPEKQWGWLDGHLYIDLAGWTRENPGGYTESMSDRHQGGQ